MRILIAGASSALGHATASALLHAGHHVIVVGSDADRLGLVDARVSEHGGAVLAEPVLTVDLRFEPKRPQARRAGKSRGTTGDAAKRGGTTGKRPKTKG